MRAELQNQNAYDWNYMHQPFSMDQILLNFQSGCHPTTSK